MDATARDIIIKTYGLETLAPEAQDDMIVKITELIFQGVLTRAMALLKKKEVDEFEQMLDADQSPEALISFLQQHVPDFIKILKEEAENFRNEAVEIMGKIVAGE